MSVTPPTAQDEDNHPDPSRYSLCEQVDNSINTPLMYFFRSLAMVCMVAFFGKWLLLEYMKITTKKSYTNK